MSPYVSAWLELAVRWIHVIVGIAWIGTSFYFNWLNAHIEPAGGGEEGVKGELWSVHGGGFYRVTKFEVAPPRMPKTLHWFKWEAYWTWLSGFALLVLVYYLDAHVYLIDTRVAAIGTGTAVLIGIGTLLAAWLIYDALCRTRLVERGALFAVLGLLLVCALAFGLTRVFGSRGAYIHVGAALGTLMAANVFRVIIPAHRDLVHALESGPAPDAAVGQQAALRSLHNNYFTLPVLFVMISAHYPMTYGHAWNWAVLGALFLIGGATRHFFNLRNSGRSPAWLLPAAALGLVVLAYVARPGKAAVIAASGAEVTYAEARAVIVTRCSTCHAAEPAHVAFDAPPGGIAFDTAEEIRRHLTRIQAVTVDSRIMPLGNLTGMTDEERALLASWIAQGAPLR